MYPISPEALWSYVFATVVTGITCFICTCALVRNLSSHETAAQGIEFSGKQKQLLRGLLLRTRSPSSRDIASLLTQREFAEQHVTGIHIRLWLNRTNFLLNKFMYEAAEEMAVLGNGGPTGPGGREMAALRGQTTTSHGGGSGAMLALRGMEIAMIADKSGDIFALRGTEVARTADKCEEMTTHSADDRSDRVVAIRGGEIAQRWRDS